MPFLGIKSPAIHIRGDWFLPDVVISGKAIHGRQRGAHENAGFVGIFEIIFSLLDRPPRFFTEPPILFA